MKWTRLLVLVFSIAVCSCSGNDSPVFGTPVEEATVSPTVTEEATPFEEVSSTPAVTPTTAPESSSPTPSEVQEFTCPPTFLMIPAASADLGASPELISEVDEEGYKTSRVPIYKVTTDDYCISSFPFPGEAGSEWPEGINLAQAEDLDVKLAEFGMRLASGSEYLMATATTSNHRWPQGVGSWAEAGCDENPYDPEVMGSHPACTSSFGTGALLTFAFWVRTDPDLEASLLSCNEETGAWPGVEAYVVLGGMPTSWDAFYGDALDGAHHHGYEEAYLDDKPGFLVSTPGEVTPDRWKAFQEYAASKPLGTQRQASTQKKNHVHLTWLKK